MSVMGIQRTMPTVEELQWAAGFFDGDGCVFCGHDCCLRVSVEQAVTYKANLLEMSRLFGGGVATCAPPKHATRNQKYRWRLCGDDAIRFCQMVEPHAVLKRPQIELGARFEKGQTRRCAVTVTDGKGGFWQTQTLSAMAKQLGCTRETVKELKVPFTVTLQKQAMSKEDKLQVRNQLMELKKQRHADIPDCLPPAYTAGFLDADGCLRLRTRRTGRYLVISANQKHDAITRALMRTHGGSVSTSNKESQWTVQGDAGFRCLHCLMPYFVGKLPQAQLLSTLTPDNQDEVAAKVTALKMHIPKEGIPAGVALPVDSSLPKC